MNVFFHADDTRLLNKQCKDDLMKAVKEDERSRLDMIIKCCWIRKRSEAKNERK